MNKQTKQAISDFRLNWKTTGGRHIAFNSKYNNRDDVFFNAVKCAYAPSTQRAMKSYEKDYSLTSEEKRKLNEGKREVFNDVVAALKNLFDQNIDTTEEFISWERNICNVIRNKFHNEKNIRQYTYGNAQKWVNVAIKYVLSSNLFSGEEGPFKVCFVPLDAIVQHLAHDDINLQVRYLSNANEHGVIRGNDNVIHSWGKCDVFENIVTYQRHLKEATDRAGYYSPIMWEITSWNI